MEAKAETSHAKPRVIRLDAPLKKNSELDDPEVRVTALTESIKKGISGVINIIHTTQFISLLITKKSQDGTAADAVLRMLVEFKGWADSILNEQSSYLLAKDEQELLRLATITLNTGKALYQYLDAIIASGLTEFKEFDGNKIFAKILKSEKVLSFEQLTKKLAEFEKETFKLQSNAEKATLTWYNVIARKVENAVLIPAQKYNLGYGLKVGGVSSAVGLLVLWTIVAEYLTSKYENDVKEAKANLPMDKRVLAAMTPEQILGAAAEKQLNGEPNGALETLLLEDSAAWETERKDKKNRIAANITRVLKAKDEDEKYWKITFRTDWMEKNVPLPLQKLFNTFGWPIPLNSQTGIIDHAEIQKNPHLYGVFSHINSFLQTMMTRTNPVITFAGGWALNEIYSWYNGNQQKGQPGFNLFLEKKLGQAWNFLRGGAYAEQPNPFQFVPQVDFSHIIGTEEIKRDFEVLIEFVLNAEMFISTGKIPERGYLLTGPTRTGKSFFIEALFGEILRRALARGIETSLRFRKVFSYELRGEGNTIEMILMIAKMYAPVMLWFDEIDLLSLQRGMGDGKNLQDFLTGMGNSFDNDPRKLVIIVATTNRPENIELALKQPGRFGKEIRFEYPPAKYRRQYIVTELAKMAMDPAQFDIEALVQKTAGKSFEDLRALIKGATIASWIRKTTFNQELLEEMIDVELRHVIMIDRKELPESEKELIATHMAAKALVQLLLSTGAERLDKVTMKAVMVSLKDEHVWQAYYKDNPKESDEKKIQYGAVFTKHLYDSANIKSYADIISEVKILLAGFAAEELVFGMSTFKFHENDSATAFKILESLVLKGMDKEKISPYQMSVFMDDIMKLRKETMNEVKELLENHRDELSAIIEALKERSMLSSNDIEDIINEVETEKLDNQQIAAEQSASSEGQQIAP